MGLLGEIVKHAIGVIGNADDLKPVGSSADILGIESYKLGNIEIVADW